MGKPRALVTFAPDPQMRDVIGASLDGVGDVKYLSDAGEGEREEALASADAVLAWMLRAELRPDELAHLSSAGLIQLLSAGVDRVPFDQIPDGVAVASNAGAYAEPMAEHVLALALALAKRLPQNHAAMARGVFDQLTPTRSIRGSLVGILGFGGIGRASARLFQALDAHVHAINRSGRTDAAVDQIGTMENLDALLSDADILVVSLPLTRTTQGLIGPRELSLMKPDAILINVARAAIIDEGALYAHLERNPSFSAGIDAWWQEPRRQRAFAMRLPLLSLPNLIGSPHNSAIVAGSLTEAAARAADNVARHLRGELVRNLIDRSDYLP
ncbi:MAG TPA: 2-hydroxyacid dehydrogenase [Solirubrobacteraceae bacterium]|nr:2-hydroxyacid dehydrogenase [Solirubrobacteraceae bacterium]